MLQFSVRTIRCKDGASVSECVYTDGAGKEVGREDVCEFRSTRFEWGDFYFSNLENTPIVSNFVNASTNGLIERFFSRYGGPLSERIMNRMDDREPLPIHLHISISKVTEAQTVLRALLSNPSPEVVLGEINGLFNSSGFGIGSFNPIFESLGPHVRQMTLRCTNLFSFMAMEIAFAAIHGAEFARCQHCGDGFFVGHMTGRRSSAKFCSDRCRVAANRALRKGSADVNPQT